ncbi:hypothetical protein HMPREF0973_02278 [Prevotella veroralis F0319]|uniref:Uncharacterized protein n=1 Tax=Prevotella veroralis F0319 TaxID=649761 RepID=C9MRL5_9BACT|nr:hypothetical protein HMPREF0973_02278 [Prevotella veroralis F0319]
MYYFSVYVNLFKELFSYHSIRYKQTAYFVKASAKVWIILIPSKYFERKV